jgi:FkbM family methyltransferase
VARLFESCALALCRAIPAGLPVPVLAGPLRGSRWIVGAAAGEGRGLGVLFNRSEAEQLACAARVLRADDVCFDIGANVGLYTLLFGKHASRVVSFEPAPRNIRYLHRIVESNRLGNVTIVPLALSDRLGLARFDPGVNPAMGRLSAEGELPAATVSLDEYVQRFGPAPSVLKIDVEGAEQAVLTGGAETIRAHRPRILLSTHGEGPRSWCTSWLRDAGYSVEALPGNGYEFFAA